MENGKTIVFQNDLCLKSLIYKLIIMSNLSTFGFCDSKMRTAANYTAWLFQMLMQHEKKRAFISFFTGKTLQSIHHSIHTFN